MHDLHMGLPDAGGDDHRPMEPVRETLPLRKFFLMDRKAVPFTDPAPNVKCRAEKG